MEYKDYYEIMGVARDATQDEIKRAYRKLARKYHPDVSKQADAEERFKEVGEAYEALKDPEKRAAYDQLGAQWQGGQEFHPPPDWDAGFEFSGGGYTAAGAEDYSAFFEELFGRGHARPSGAGVKAPTPSGIVDLKVPANSNQGRKLRLKGRGLPGKEPGDLYVILQVTLPPADSVAAKTLYKQMQDQLGFDPRATMGVS